MIQDWPGEDDRLVVATMISDTDSPHWEKCRQFIVQQLFKLKYPPGEEDDIVQLTLLAIRNNLAHFGFRARLTSWITRITDNKAKDALRAAQRRNSQNISIEASQEQDNEGAHIDIADAKTLEEDFLIRESLHEVISELRAFTTQHPNTRIRNARIIELALIEKQPAADVAQHLGINRQIVYTVLRAAQDYLSKHVKKRITGYTYWVPGKDSVDGNNDHLRADFFHYWPRLRYYTDATTSKVAPSS
ncbi:MAG: sigma-70 family RNA polymerase sigma factor [Ktedonobacteraceae bacterium]|nr:sigma-70 family RNA polymerase sigma factor [Ktedonobacteraceae bacterium]